MPETSTYSDLLREAILKKDLSSYFSVHTLTDKAVTLNASKECTASLDHVAYNLSKGDMLRIEAPVGDDGSSLLQAVLNLNPVVTEKKENTMDNMFDFTTALRHIAAGRRVRRTIWDEGKYIQKADTTIQLYNINGERQTYHGTRDFFATDFVVVVETTTFDKVVNHLRTGGQAYRLGWKFPDETRIRTNPVDPATVQSRCTRVSNGWTAWAPYAYEFMASDWVLV